MASASSSIVINKPPADVFDFVTNPEKMMVWQGIPSVSLSPDGPVGLGSVYTYVTKVMGKDYESQVEVTEFEQDSKWTITTRGVPNPVATNYIFEPEGDGTKLTIAMELSSGYPAAAAGMVQKQMQQQFDSSVQMIKSAIEG